MNKRLVILHATAGAYKGLYQIMGRDQADPPTEVFPSTLEHVSCFGRDRTVTLAAVNERYVLYRENIE